MLLGSLGVDPKQYPQYQKMRLGRLFEYLDVDGDRRIVSPLEEPVIHVLEAHDQLHFHSVSFRTRGGPQRVRRAAQRLSTCPPHARFYA